MLRLFIALSFPEEIKRLLSDIIDTAKPMADGVKWVEPANIHLTLKFIGDTPEQMVPAILGGIESALMGMESCEVSLNTCGGFPNLRKPRVIWVGLEGADPIIEMAKRIDAELSAIGIEKDKKRFSPHITLGRIKRPGNYSRLASHLESLNIPSNTVILRRVALIKSTLTRHGPIYEEIKTFELE